VTAALDESEFSTGSPSMRWTKVAEQPLPPLEGAARAARTYGYLAHPQRRESARLAQCVVVTRLIPPVGRS
jgi:hypothetical protein